MVPLGTHGVPPLVTTVVGAIAGVEIHLYFHVTVPRVSVGRLAHLLAGLQNPVTVNFTPVTVTTAPPPVTCPPQLVPLIFIWNLSPPGLPCRVSAGENVAVPATLHPTIPDPGGAVLDAELTPGATTTPTSVDAKIEAASSPIGFRTIVTSPGSTKILGRGPARR